MKAKDIAS
jgi:hypothetical protein